MDWLKKNYDLALLGLASLAVAASAALFALGGPGESEQPMLPPMPQRPDAQAPASPIETVRQATALLESAPTAAPKNQSEAELRGWQTLRPHRRRRGPPSPAHQRLGHRQQPRLLEPRPRGSRPGPGRLHQRRGVRRQDRPRRPSIHAPLVHETPPRPLHAHPLPH
jgi:hypothetical protein